VKRNTEDHLVREIYPNSIKVSVKDSGIGIKPEDLSKLFQIFGRV
jgi:signal transduction histidine kinase